jgi:allantoinase
MPSSVRSTRVALPDGVRPATIRMPDGLIVAIDDYSSQRQQDEVDVGNLMICPGLVDTHVHINEPGRTDWEGFASATRAAAAGGVTTIVDMPLNSIPATTSVEALEHKRAAAASQCHVDVGFWGGVVPGNEADLEPLARAGVLGFKCFLSPSGVAEFEQVSERDLRDAMPILARLDLPLLVHAELPTHLMDPAAGSDPRHYATWLNTRPAIAERAAIDLVLTLAREFGTRVHIVHVTSDEAVAAINAARASGALVTAETCPHYLTFASEDIADAATAFKCAPPIRDRRQRDALWEALLDNSLEMIATDHSPAPPSLKVLDEGNFITAWGGVASLQIGFAAVWTAARARGVPVDRVVHWLSTAPACLAGLHSKGTIKVGCDADLVIWDPDEEMTVNGASLYHRHPVTPYHGARLRGVVHTTLLRGQVVFDNGGCRGGPSGRLLAGRGA